MTELSVRPDELRWLATDLEETGARLSRAGGRLDSAADLMGHRGLEDAVRDFGRAWTDGLAEIASTLEACIAGLRVAADAYAGSDLAIAEAIADAGCAS